jgi:6-phosphofructokinase 1
MDNDVWGTEGCLGFDTAANTVTDALDRIQTTTASHHRVSVVEVMGRDAGWVAAWGGLAGGADAILIPEVTLDVAALDQLVGRLIARRDIGDGSSVIVVSEGVQLPVAAHAVSATAAPLDEFGHPRLDKIGVGDALATLLEERTGLEVRCTRLGHLQRGGAPSAADRVLGARYGVAAVEALEAQHFGVMVALRAGAIVEVPLAEVGGRNRSIDSSYPPLFEALS